MSTLLDSRQLAITALTLRLRIEERFAGSGLSGVCAELVSIAESASERCKSIAKPLLGLRVTVGVIIALIIGGFLGALWMLESPAGSLGLTELIQILEPGVNIVVLVGAAVLFLLTVETRIKRRHALRAIHQLRDLAHLVDVHQLTKGPDRLLVKGEDTLSSPKREMTSFEMGRYLNYCSEMLSLIGKIAALYAQHIEDAVALAAVDSIESLTTNLSRKIWQKIMMLQNA